MNGQLHLVKGDMNEYSGHLVSNTDGIYHCFNLSRQILLLALSTGILLGATSIYARQMILCL